MSKWFGYTGGYAAGKGSPGPPPKTPAAVAPKKNLVDIDDVIAYLDRCAANAYSMGFTEAGSGYDRAATRLFAAKTQGEFEEAS